MSVPRRKALAVVIRATFSRGTIGPSMKGRLYSYTSKYGEITSSWPTKRGRRSSDLDKFNQEMFREACIATKVMDPSFIAYHAEKAKGTPMLPRDALVAALYGKGPVIFLPDGTRRIPMATRVDMSMMMDNVEWRAGSLLWRGPEVWQGIRPPNELSILSYDVELGPRWIEASGVGGSKIWMMPIGTSLTGHNSPCKGNKWMAYGDIFVDAVQARHTIGAGVNFNWSIYRVTSTGGILDIVLDHPNPVPGQGGDQMDVLEFPSPITLPGGHQYIIAIRVPGISDTYNMGVRNGGLIPLQMSLLPDQARYWCTKANPQVGDSFTFDSSSQLYMVGFRGR